MVTRIVNMKFYPLKLYRGLSFKNDDEHKRIQEFFNSKAIQNKCYNVVVWIKGDEDKQEGIIPVGSVVEIALQVGNGTRYGKNIEGVFDFEINPDGLYDKCSKISDWLDGHKNS